MDGCAPCVRACRFACSTTVNELPGKKQSGGEIVMQGHVEGVHEFLSKAYGIPRRYIK